MVKLVLKSVLSCTNTMTAAQILFGFCCNVFLVSLKCREVTVQYTQAMES